MAAKRKGSFAGRDAFRTQLSTPSMSQHGNVVRIIVLACSIFVLAAGFTVALPHVKDWRKPPASAPIVDHHRAELVPSQADALRLPPQVAEKLGVTAVAAIPAPPPAPLRLEGSLFLDPNRLTHVHTRFAGEVVELGKVKAEGDESGDDAKGNRAIRYGDSVKKDQLLCVVWSKDLGEKKSELVDALSRLRNDNQTLTRLKKLYMDGAGDERSLREMERNVQSDLISVARAERTLRSWRLSDADIDEIRAEEERIHQGKEHPEQHTRESWARVEVRAALDGVVVEKNIAVGDVVETTLDLFKIANLAHLDVLAHAYEEDLPMLERLSRAQRKWHIFLKSDPQGKPLAGSFDQIGSIIDPNQHTAIVMGWVDNSDGRLRVGQFITAAIDLPAYPDETAIPVTALVDSGNGSYVFVQPERTENRYVRQRVHPIRRREIEGLGNLVYVSARPTPAQLNSGIAPLQPGDLVITSGGIELAAKLQDLEAESRAENAHPSRSRSK